MRRSSRAMGSSGSELSPVARGVRSEYQGDREFEDLFSLGRLRKTWKSIRREFRDLRARDVIDWNDWAISLDQSLSVLRKEVIEGSYQPQAPTRYELGKGQGSFRSVTQLNIRDAIVYRHISDAALERAIPHKVPGAYYSRRHRATPVGKTLGIPESDPYLRWFDIWIRYHEYRTRTLLNQPYNVLVVTDITNYFDSIQHDLLLEYLAPLGLPRKAIAILGKLLEVLKPTSGHSVSPRVGLAVDELDCSRQLAHLFLFEHDWRIVSQWGKDNYVRWMDDQNIGVRDMTEARRVVNALTRSLALQRLTLNAGKTRFLRPDEVASFFHLGVNDRLTKWEAKYRSVSGARLKEAKVRLEKIWRDAVLNGEPTDGHWDKVLKRFYGYAMRVDSDIFESMALEHLIRYPQLDERIFAYLAKRNRAAKLYELFREYSRRGENLFEATEMSFFEAALLLDLSGPMADDFRELAIAFATGDNPHCCGRPMGRASAILLLYWLGYQNITDLFNAASGPELPKEVARAWLAAATALRGKDGYLTVLERLFGHPADDVARLSRFLHGILHGDIETLGQYKSQKDRWPLPGKYYDPRSWLILDLASLSPNKRLLRQAKDDYRAFVRLARTRQEKEVAARVRARLGAV